MLPQTNLFPKIMQFQPPEATIDEDMNAAKSTEQMEITNEDIDGTPEYNDEDGNNSPLRDEGEEEDDDDDDEDDDDDNPGEASVPRKLWKFFTS